MRARPLVAADPTRWPADLRIETVFAEAETHRRAQPIRFFSASEIRHELARLRLVPVYRGEEGVHLDVVCAVREATCA